MSGDVSLAADFNFPDTAGYFDRKAVLIIRQALEDDSKEAMAALHGGGLIHLAWRPEKGQSIKEMRVDKRGALRLGLVNLGDFFTSILVWLVSPCDSMETLFNYIWMNHSMQVLVSPLICLTNQIRQYFLR